MGKASSCHGGCLGVFDGELRKDLLESEQSADGLEIIMESQGYL